MSYLEAPRSQRSQIILDDPRISCPVKVVSHGLSGCNKKKIKNKLVSTRSGEFTSCGESGYKWTSG